MTAELLVDKISKFPEKYIEELSIYVDFLEYKAKSKEPLNLEPKKKPKSTPGGAKGHFWMADDFDETPDCFKD